jgi:hypothetical protein
MAATADYLRPFAPEGTAGPGLPNRRELDFWTDPVGHQVPDEDDQGWQAPSPSGQMPDFSPPRSQPPASAEEGIWPAGPMYPPVTAYQGDDTYPPAAPGELGPGDAYPNAQGRSVTLSGEAYSEAPYDDPGGRRASGGATSSYRADGERYDANDAAPLYPADEDRYDSAADPADTAQPYPANGERYDANDAAPLYPAGEDRYDPAADPANTAPPYPAGEDRYDPAADPANTARPYPAEEDRYGPSGTAWAYANADRIASGAPSQTDPVVPYVAAEGPFPADAGHPAEGAAPWMPADQFRPADARAAIPAANDYSASYQGESWSAEQAGLVRGMGERPAAGLVADAGPGVSSPWEASPDAPPSSDRQKRRFRRPAASTPGPDRLGSPLAPDPSESGYRGLPPDSAIPAAPARPPAGAGAAADRRLEPRPVDPTAARSVRPADHGRWITFAAAAIVLVIAGAGAAILLAQHDKPHVASRPKPGSTTARRPTTAPTVSTPGGGLITAEPGTASAPHATAVVAFLTRYFTAINDHDYAAYRRLFSPSLRGGLSPTAFASGYGSSKDSQATLHSISVPGAGQLDAAVTFTSHQQSTASATNSSCTDWSISLFLIRHGHSYVIESPPAGYHSTSTPCS